MTLKAAILGASGYTGAELVRILATHPRIEIAALSADRKAGQGYDEVFPHLRHLKLPALVRMEEIDFSAIDLVFCALPHGLSQPLVGQLPRNVKIVDLGAISGCAIRRITRNGMGWTMPRPRSSRKRSMG